MDALSIEIGRGSWRFLHVKATLKGSRVISQMEIGGTNGERASAIARYIAEKGLAAVKVGIVLSREVSISKALDIPAPSLNAVEGIIRFEIEKHLPLAITETYYGCQVMGKKGTTYSVLAGAAEKKQVDELIAIFSSAGLSVSFIGFWHEAILNSLAHFGEIGKESQRVFIGTCGHEMTLDAFCGFMPLYSKRIELDGVLTAQVIQRELSVMAACLRIEPEEFSIILSTDLANFHFSMSDGLPGKARLLDLKGMLEASGLAAFGGALAAIGSGKCRINLLKGTGADKGKYFGSAVFIAAALILICLVGISYIAKDMMTLNRLDGSISRFKALKDSSGAKAGKLEAPSTRIAALEAVSGTQSELVLDLLKEITEFMPGDSWLTSIEYKQGAVIMEGHSGDASSLLIKLETSKYLDDFEFVAPVTRVSKSKEKFRIKARVKSLKGGKA